MSGVVPATRFPGVTRIEVIDWTGRAYTAHKVASHEIQLQDDGRTLKIFIEKENPDARA